MGNFMVLPKRYKENKKKKRTLILEFQGSCKELYPNHYSDKTVREHLFPPLYLLLFIDLSLQTESLVKAEFSSAMTFTTSPSLKELIFIYLLIFNEDSYYI